MGGFVARWVYLVEPGSWMVRHSPCADGADGGACGRDCGRDDSDRPRPQGMGFDCFGHKVRSDNGNDRRTGGGWCVRDRVDRVAGAGY